MSKPTLDSGKHIYLTIIKPMLQCWRQSMQWLKLS